MVYSLINENRRNLDTAKYVKMKMLTRYAKPLSFLIRDMANKYNSIGFKF